MALPIEVPRDYRSPFGHEVDGPRIIDREMYDDTAIRQWERYPRIDFLGAGDRGLAVDLGSGYVGKYTTSSDEAYAATKLMERPLDGIVNVFSVEKIQTDLWLIVMERVEQLSPLDVKIFNSIFAVSPNRIKEEYRNSLPSNFSEEEKQYADVVCQKYLEWKQNKDFSFRDEHAGNFGWKNGKLVVLDIESVRII